jgi:polysaccharide deacetylase family protein (PEP-CTERM system associated)
MICLTFDVEERFHSHLTPHAAPRQWTAGARMARILDLLEEGGHRATFFVVGEFAEHYPDLIRRMAAGGFEIASHSHTHPRLDGDDREAIKRDIVRSKEVLEALTGRPVIGFRAPSWTAQRSDGWLWDLLADNGFRYDSSLFPFKTHRYGSIHNPVEAYALERGLLEIPPSVARFGPLRIPYGGGFYFRLYPRWLTRTLINRDMSPERSPIVYFHPWEFDPEERTMEQEPLNRFIANYNAGGSWEAFKELLQRYPTTAMCDLLEPLGARIAAGHPLPADNPS